MTSDEVMRMAREAGDDWDYTLPEDKRFLERFAGLVASAERNNWPEEMKAMERQVCILTDELAKANSSAREMQKALIEAASVIESIGYEAITARAAIRAMGMV